MIKSCQIEWIPSMDQYKCHRCDVSFDKDETFKCLTDVEIGNKAMDQIRKDLDDE